MQLKFTTPNGITTVKLGQSPVPAGGQQPTGMPGDSALQIIAGWGHGATSGLGGADWVAGCGVFRGEAYRQGPSFNQLANDVDACAAAGISRICSPASPFGVWLFPWTVNVAPATQVRMNLTMPVAARLFAYEVCVAYVTPEGPEPPPIPDDGGCCDCSGPCSHVTIGGWNSRQITTTYPGLGRDTGSQVLPAGAVVPYNPNAEAVSACLYTPKRLLDGQNFLPPWVPNVDLKNGNDELSWLIGNTQPAGGLTMRVSQILHIKYGDFDLKAAVEEYCESQQACAC